MDWSVALGVGGIFVSVAVGWFTYYLADKKQRRNRYLAAKNAVAAALSRSLSESNVPSYELIAATIRSVLRDENTSNVDSVTVQEITDDLIRQVSSDPFLAADRRRELQQTLLSVSAKQTVTPTSELAVTHRDEDVETSWRFSSSSMSVLLGFIASLFSLFLIKNYFATAPTPTPADSAARLRTLDELVRRALLAHSTDSFFSTFFQLMPILIFLGILIAMAHYYLERRR